MIRGRHDTQHNDIQHNDTQHNGASYDAQHNSMSAIMLSVLMLCCDYLNVMLSVVMLNVIMLSVVAPIRGLVGKNHFRSFRWTPIPTRQPATCSLHVVLIELRSLNFDKSLPMERGTKRCFTHAHKFNKP